MAACAFALSLSQGPAHVTILLNKMHDMQLMYTTESSCSQQPQQLENVDYVLMLSYLTKEGHIWLSYKQQQYTHLHTS